ncbi:MAG: hypothetical protein JWO40_302 [Candidatus Doudnabacteria bacterium]|nr:hypothetical protein [Candidatus Doudnabacteria bacterium]
MKKIGLKFLLAFSTIVVGVFALMPVANAHVLKSDGEVGAVLHIDPDDDPIANEPAAFYFAIKDTSGKFDPSKCDCHFIVTKDQQTVFDKPISIIKQSGEWDGIIGYTFTDRAIYSVLLKGTPKTTNAFQPFNLDYDIRVSRTANATAPGTSNSSSTQIHLVHFVLFGIAFIAIFYIIWDEKRKGRKTSKRPDQIIKSLIIVLALSSFVFHSSGLHCSASQNSSQLPCCAVAPTGIIVKSVTVEPVEIVWRSELVQSNFESIQVDNKVSNKSPPLQTQVF